MKYMLLKYVIGSALKLAFAYALRIVRNSITKLNETLTSSTITDAERDRLSVAVQGLYAVADLLEKFSTIIGTPELPLMSSSDDNIHDAVEKLRRITDGL
jgi:predicted RNA binding protein with dsRBD fold (UPF0201 family)